jgi:hypothetical protein
MEGHPIYEDPGAAPIPGRRSHPSDSTKKRAFLLLEGERRSLAAELRPLWRLKGRYEDLSLVMMLARLQRDCLSQPRWRLDGGVHLQGDGDQPAPRLADWAQPWGAAPRMKLETDLGHVDGALRGLGRWLPARTAAKAQDRARERLEAITANLGVRDWARAWAPRPHGEAPTARDRAAPTRVAAIAGLSLLAAGAGAFLLLSDSGGGPGDSIGVGAVDGRDPAGLQADTKREPAQPSRGSGQSASRGGDPKAQSSALPRSQGAGQTAPVAAEAVPPAPEPAAVSPSAVAPAPAPAPAPSSPQPSPTSGQAKGAGGAGGCPPEFGYEC